MTGLISKNKICTSILPFLLDESQIIVLVALSRKTGSVGRFFQFTDLYNNYSHKSEKGNSFQNWRRWLK